MPALSKDAKLRKLQAAHDYVANQIIAGTKPEEIIASLVAEHGAAHRPRWDLNRLSCAGVSSTCTSDAGRVLLANWRKNASLRLINAAWAR